MVEPKDDMKSPLEQSALFNGTLDVETKEVEEKTKKSPGRPRVHDPNMKGAKKGLYPGETRATFILKEEVLNRLKDYAYTERITIREAFHEIVSNFLDEYEKTHELLDHTTQKRKFTGGDKIE